MSEATKPVSENGKMESQSRANNSVALISRMPDLERMEVASVDMSSEYWSPDEVGEKRRMIFWEVRSCPSLDFQSGEMVELESAIFVQKIGETVKSIRNASRLLVAVFEHGNVTQGTAVEITYLGKKKAKRSGNMCDQWSVVLLQERVGT